MRGRPVRRLHGPPRRRGCALLSDGWSRTSAAGPSRPSRAFPPTGAIRCNRPGCARRCRSAGTASRGRSCRRRPCSPRRPARATPTSMWGWPATSAGAAPTRGSGRPSTLPLATCRDGVPPGLREGRRGHRRRAHPRRVFPGLLRRGVARPRGRSRAERLPPDLAGRQGDGGRRPLGDGAGCLDRPGDDRGRRARRRLVRGPIRPGPRGEGVLHRASHLRVPAPDHGREYEHPQLLDVDAPRRRHGAGHADRRGGGPMGSAGGRLPDRGRRGAARGQRANGRVRLARGRGVRAGCAERRSAQGPEGVPDHRPAARSAGQSRQGPRGGHLRAGCPDAWHGLRQRGALPGVRWPGGHGGGRSGGARGVRRAGRGAARRSGGGRGRALLAGREGAARAHRALGRGHRGRSRQRGNQRPTHGAARGLQGNGRTAGGRCGVVAVRGGGADHRPLRRTVPGARHDGADELHGLGARRSGGSVGSDPVPDGPVDGQRWRLARGSGKRSWGLDRSGDHQHDLSWRRLRSSTRGGLRVGGRAGRQGSRPSGAGHLVPRRRRAARLLPADHCARAHGDSRPGWDADGLAPANRLPGDHPRLAAALDSGLVPEPHGHPRARHRALRG